MRYPASVTREGKYYLAAFPDLPGCQSFAESMEELAREARDALTVRLRTDLADREAPARPSTRLRLPKGAKLLTVAVPAKLAVPLSIRWARTGESRRGAGRRARAGAGGGGEALASALVGPITTVTVSDPRQTLRRSVSLTRRPRRPDRAILSDDVLREFAGFCPELEIDPPPRPVHPVQSAELCFARFAGQRIEAGAHHDSDQIRRNLFNAFDEARAPQVPHIETADLVLRLG